MTTPEAEVIRHLAERVDDEWEMTPKDMRYLLTAIASWMERNDRPGTRPLNIPCPHCGHDGVVHVHDISGDPTRAVVVCPECGERWQEHLHG